MFCGKAHEAKIAICNIWREYLLHLVQSIHLLG